MQVIAYNSKQLDVVMRDMLAKFDQYKSLAVSYDRPYREKTLRQLGYIFGGLVKSIALFYKSKQIIMSKEDIKYNLYKACAEFDERLVRNIHHFTGEVYQVPKQISEMDLEEASIFIDGCLRVIDNSKYFEGLVLHPSLRYTWIRHITKDELLRANAFKFPRSCPEYLAHTRTQACLCCGRMNQSEPHHLKVAGYTGTSYKADDWLTIPLCHDCHIADLHQHGQEAFMVNFEWVTKYVDLINFCRIRYLRWLNKL